jgi:ribosomal protein L12E/L44/L45/RPP1/RPP2
MEGEEIGLVLARASDLRARISACAAAARPEGAARGGGEGEDDEEEEQEEEEQGEEVVDSLVGIGDALESLERQLASLQVCPSVDRI